MKKKNIKWIDIRKYCLNKNGFSAIQKFIEENYWKLGLDNPKHNIDQKKMALNVIISNVVDEYTSGKFTAIPFYRDYYTRRGNDKLSHNTYKFIVGGTKALIKNGFIELIPGVYHYKNNENNRVSSVRAKKLLIDELNKYITVNATAQNYFEVPEYVTYIFSEDEFAKIKFDCVVELKDSEKNLINYRPNRESEKSKKFLHEYNSFIDTFDILIPVDKIKPNKYKLLEINTTSTTNTIIEYSSNTSIPLIGFCQRNYILNKKLDCRLKRTFNNTSFYQGGRFYDAEYQWLSEEERSWITINGDSTVEIDYSGLHGRMIYHYYEKIDYLDDPYLVGGIKELRPAFKKLFQMCINATGRTASIRAFRKSLIEDDDGWEIKRLIHKHNVSPEWLYDKLLEKHQRISKHFSSGVGIRLQFIDSEIAMNILKRFMRKGIACLCVHDSFIVQEKRKDELIEVMREEYRRKIGFECLLKVDRKII
ncbi:MAG: hypothetical protein D8M26_11060 [Ignavibacteriae bacterium]|nr:hypothetical protein [Ignavibacteriota bacterium]